MQNLETQPADGCSHHAGSQEHWRHPQEILGYIKDVQNVINKTAFQNNSVMMRQPNEEPNRMEQMS